MRYGSLRVFLSASGTRITGVDLGGGLVTTSWERKMWDHFGVKVVEDPGAELLTELEHEAGSLAPMDLEM